MIRRFMIKIQKKTTHFQTFAAYAGNISDSSWHFGACQYDFRLTEIVDQREVSFALLRNKINQILRSAAGEMKAFHFCGCFCRAAMLCSAARYFLSIKSN